ncbi:MAG: hypothetical protein H0X33_03225 [Taibaiella sp.]|nr:hypothetical protein [Taibaiella sp.]
MRKRITFLFLVIFSFTARAQHTIHLVHMWQKPQVHLVYKGFHLFFTIKDINTTLQYLHRIDATLYPDSTSGLDENKLYGVELVEGRDMEYMNRLQPIMQKEAGAFMLMRGHAYIETQRHKRVKVIISEAGPAEDHNRNTFALIHFFDTKTGKELFAGMMNLALQSKYLELQ